MRNSITLRKIMTYLLHLIFILMFFNSTYSITQVNCTGDTPYITVDLSADPSMTIETIAVIRDGSCCNGADENCVEFTIFLHPDAEGILFDVASGANPGGALDYQLNCGPITASGSEPICLDGEGPHHISFCKPGSNQNTYEITSVPGPTTSEDVIAADGCTDTLFVSGLDPESITWNSIAPGGYGNYNHLLSDEDQTETGITGVGFTGYETVLVTPDTNSPTEIQYEVCGEGLGSCSSNTFCDTITVTIVPDLTAEINPQVPSICFGGSEAELLANVTGGEPPYTYLWSTGETTQGIIVTNAGIYHVDVNDQTGCHIATDTVEVLVFENPITANAGIDVSICQNPTPTIPITGLVTGTNTGEWATSGDGVFSPSPADLEATYTPSSNDINNGSVVLSLSTTNNGSCPGDTDEITIDLTDFESDIQTVVVDVDCNGNDNGSITLNVNGGYPITSYNWSNGENTQNISDLEPDLYEVILTDENGCTDTVEATISEPNPLIITDVVLSNYPSGHNISCNGASDGSITYTIDGGTPNYNFDWSNGATTQNLVDVVAGTYTVVITDDNGCEITETFELLEPDPLTLNTTVSEFASGDNISCFEAADGSIDLTVSGGAPDYNYSWTGPNNFNSTDQNISNLETGTYEIDVVDENGCTILSTINLTEPDPLNISLSALEYASGDNISCFEAADGSIDLTVSGGVPNYSLEWTGPNGFTSIDQNISGLEPGTYEVVVTDLNGCTIDASITLIEPDDLSVELIPEVYSGGYNTTGCSEDGSIEANINGGSPNYTLNWSTGETSAVINDLGEGTYYINVVDINGCIVTDTVILTAPPTFDYEINAPTYAGGWNISCHGFNDGSINLDVTGGVGPFSFNWNNGATSQNLTDITSENYSVVITDASGCIDTATIVLNEPNPLNIETFVTTNYNGSDISCFGADDGGVQTTVTGGTPNYEYVWTDIQGAVLGNSNSLNNLSPGVYTVVVTDENGCTINQDISVTEPNEVLVDINILTDFDGMPVSCENTEDGSVSANPTGGTGSYQFSWDTNPITTSQTLSNIGIGTYNVTVIDVNGCQATANVVLEGHPIPDFSYSDYGLYCEGDTAIVASFTDANNSCQWVFSTGHVINQCGEFSIDLNTVGCVDAELFVTNEFGCINSEFLESYICFEPIPDASFNQSDFQITTIPSNVQFWSSSGGGYHYEWDFGDGFGSSEINPNHFFPDEAAGTYEIQLIVTSMFGCVDTSYSIVEVQEEFIMYVPNTFTPDGDQFNETFLPVLTSGYDPYSYHLIIFNRWGEVLFESYDKNVGWDGTYGGKTVKDGTYIWKINVSDKANAQRREIKGHVNVLR